MANETTPPQAELEHHDLDRLTALRKRGHSARLLWRLSAWGGAAAIALMAVAVATQTQGASERLQLAFARDSRPLVSVAKTETTPRAADIAAEKTAETHVLEAQVLALAADRDRLVARIASLEHNLNDVTGSIKRQAAAMPAERTPVPAPAPAPVVSAPPASTPVVSMNPAPSRPASAAAPPVIAPLAMPAGNSAAASWPATSATPPAPEAAPPAIPMPPTRLAAAPANEPAAATPRKPEFGVDLGGAPNIVVLNARWAAVKANFGPLLAGLHPLAAHDHRPGATDYRLLVGPLPTPAAAAQLCGRFAAARVTCRPTKFAGERLALH